MTVYVGFFFNMQVDHQEVPQEVHQEAHQEQVICFVLLGIAWYFGIIVVIVVQFVSPHLYAHIKSSQLMLLFSSLLFCFFLILTFTSQRSTGRDGRVPGTQRCASRRREATAAG